MHEAGAEAGPGATLAATTDPARPPGALPHDQLHGVEVGSRGGVVAVEQVHQTRHPGGAERSHRDAHGRQGWVDVLETRDVVEAGHGDVARDSNATSPQL